MTSMTLDEFLDIREKKEITASMAMKILEMCGYPFSPIDTHCVDAIENKGKPTEYHYQKANCKTELDDLKLPHFAYIKFYCKKGYRSEGDKDKILDHIYALVVGKTNIAKQDISFRPPEKPRGSRGDKAKWWIKDREQTFQWYDEKVLIVWTPELKSENPTTDKQEELHKVAISLEGKIRRLFGLFSS